MSDRVAWHEVGHLAVSYYLSNHCMGAQLPSPAQLASTVPNNNGPMPKTADEWLNTVAFMHGGRAAVEYAIENGKLPLPVPGLEVKHGLDGFLRHATMPVGVSDQERAWTYAGSVSGWTQADAYCEGLDRARVCIAANITKIENLVLTLISQTKVSESETANALK